MLNIIVPCVFWWRMCLTSWVTELVMFLFSFQVSDLLTAFRPPVWSNVDRVVLLREFEGGSERELWGRQRHQRTQSGVSVSVIMYVSFIRKCSSVKNLGTSVRKENSNSCRFYGNNSTRGMLAAVKFSALSANLRTVVYTDMLHVRERTDWVCFSWVLKRTCGPML
jgi:hypothetical protein